MCVSLSSGKVGHPAIYIRRRETEGGGLGGGSSGAPVDFTQNLITCRQKYSLWKSKRVEVRWVSSWDRLLSSLASAGVPQ